MNTTRRTFLGADAASVLTGGGPAQSGFPTKPNVVYGELPAGGIMDQRLGLRGERMLRTLNQAITVDARPGAGATIAPTLLLNAHHRPSNFTFGIVVHADSP